MSVTLRDASLRQADGKDRSSLCDELGNLLVTCLSLTGLLPTLSGTHACLQ